MRLLLCFLSLAGIVTLPPSAATCFHPPRQDQPLKVALMANIFGNLDQDRAVQQVKTLAAEVEKRTGTKADFHIAPDMESLERDMKSDRVQLAILHGIDYARARPYLPKAKPMLIAVSDKPTLQSVVVARSDHKATDILTFKGENFALPGVTPYHVRLFLKNQVGAEPGQFFQIQETRTAEEALEAVINGKAKATVVSDSVWDLYQEMKPVRAKRLKVVVESPPFPAPVLILRPSPTVDTKLVERFVNAMLKVHESDAGRQTLTLWRLRRFEQVPQDYTQQLDAVAKKYPSEK